MKKKIAFTLTLVMLAMAALTACGQTKTPAQTPSSSPENSSAATPTLNYPTKNIEVMVGFGAGGPTDLSIRGLLDAASPNLPSGVTFVVTNKTGGSGVIALTDALSSKADGYKLCVENTDLLIQRGLGLTEISTEQLIPLACTLADPYGLIVSSDAEYQSVEELVTYMKAHPGEVICANSGTGAPPYLAALVFEDFFDVTFKHVSFDGSADCVTNLVGGHVDVTFAQVSPAQGQLEAGTLQMLAVMANDRLKALPDVPSIKELYDDVDFQIVGWVMVAAPAETAPEQVEYLKTLLRDAAASDAYAETLGSLGMQAKIFEGDEDMNQFIAEQASFYEELCAGLE